MSDRVFIGEPPEVTEARDRTVRVLATRLGVEPLSESSAWTMVELVLSDGTRYSLESLIHAHLDLMGVPRAAEPAP